MKQMKIRLDEQIYEDLRRWALERGCSLSSLVRVLLAQALGTRKPECRATIEDFTFIAAGRSRQDRLSPVSERHDDVLEAILIDDHRQSGDAFLGAQTPGGACPPGVR